MRNTEELLMTYTHWTWLLLHPVCETPQHTQFNSFLFYTPLHLPISPPLQVLFFFSFFTSKENEGRDFFSSPKIFLSIITNIYPSLLFPQSSTPLPLPPLDGLMGISWFSRPRPVGIRRARIWKKKSLIFLGFFFPLLVRREKWKGIII